MKLLTTTTAAALLAAAATAHAATVTETYGPFTPGTTIADNDPVLTPFLLSLDSSAILSLSEVTIRFELRGSPGGDGFASDLFASLMRTPLGDLLAPADPTAVLLNRVGVTDLNPVGYAYDGWDITLSDGAATDIHTVNLAGGVLGGTFQPDGRLVPTDDGRPALLGVFAGLPGNGDWRLNLGDFNAGGTMELVSWELTLTGDTLVPAVPEASTWAAGAGLAALFGGGWWRRSRLGSNP